MSAGGFLDDTELLAFGRTPMPQVTPVLAQYQRPSMNVAPAIDTANRFAEAQARTAATKQATDFNAKIEPLKIEALKAEIHNSLDQMSQNERWQTQAKAGSADDIAQYIKGLPQEQQATAWSQAGDAMYRAGIMTQAEADTWKATKPADYTPHAGGLGDVRKIIDNYMLARGGKGGGSSYENLKPTEKIAIDKQAVVEAKAAAGTSWDGSAKEPTKEQIDAARKSIIERFGYGGGSAYAPPASAAPAKPAASGGGSSYDLTGVPGAGAMFSDPSHPVQSAVKDFITDTESIFGGSKPGAPPPASGITKAAPPTAGADDAASKAGNAVADRNAARANMTNATGKSAADAIGYIGKPADEDGQNKWFDALQPGQWFINPKDGQPMQKRADETLQQAEGG